MYISNATVHVVDTKSELMGWDLTPSSTLSGHCIVGPYTDIMAQIPSVPPKLKEACIKRPLGKICARSSTPANMRRGFTKSRLSHLSDLSYLSYFSIFSLLSVCIYVSYATILILSHQNSGWMYIHILYASYLSYLSCLIASHLFFSFLILSCLIFSYLSLSYLIVFIFSFGASCSGVM